MIAVDSSALVAILLGEPDAERLARTIQAQRNVITAANLFETAMVVLSRQGPDAERDLRVLVEQFGMDVASVDDELAWAAQAAWRRFGKGRHPAGLNFGDCFSYALAKSLGVPLLFKGDDFSQTDVGIAT